MNRHLLHAGAAGAIALSLLASTSHAAPVAYEEAFNVDLPDSDPLTHFTFDVGNNTVGGSLSMDDFDDFAFTIPAPLYLQKAVVHLGPGDINATDWGLYTGPLRADASTIITSYRARKHEFVDLPGLSAGTYHLMHSPVIGAGTSGYQFTFIVVPEPASLGVLALGGLALARRRR